MSQGIFIRGRCPKTKKQVKEAVASDPDSVRLERTAWVGDEFDGLVSEAPDGTYYFVGPDPFTKRAFYGTLTVTGGKARVK